MHAAKTAMIYLFLYNVWGTECR